MTTALHDVGYTRPRSLDDAVETRAAHPDWLVLAGGTDLMVGAPGRRGPSGVLDLFGLAVLHGVVAADDRIRIGACTTYAELLADDTVRTHLPLLRAAAGDVGALQIRERGTIGGNVVSASPVGDMLPGLLALDASIVLESIGGRREIPYEEFVTGFRAVDLRPEEIVTAIVVPVPLPGTVQQWRKVGTRAAQAITKVSIAAAARTVDGRLEHVRLAFGAVADRPVRLHHAESIAEGQEPGLALAEAVGSAIAEALRPITDVRSTADYRRDVAADLAARFIRALGESTGG
jgi:CO/xanthine dehydrogenase FAD-binding subunit